MKWLNKILDVFTVKSPRPIILMDWFAELGPPTDPYFKVCPKRCRDEHFAKASKTLVDNEILVNITTRRIYQRLDGVIVEWVAKSSENVV